MKFLVIVAVERDAITRDVHEEISPVRETVVHLLQRMHDEIHRRVQALVDRKFADEPVIELEPIIDAFGQPLVIDDDEQIEVGSISLCSMGLIDPTASRVAAIEDDLFDPPFFLPLLLGERQCILELLKDDLDKRRLMDNYWPWGWRLEPEEVSRIEQISITPARGILYQLVGEDMLSYFPRQGFYVPRISEAELRDLFEHHQNLILIAIKSLKYSSAISADGAYPERVSKFFLQLGSRSGNGALIRDISKHNDHLYQFRRCDSKLFEDIESELEDIIGAANDDPKGAKLRRLIKRYFNRRIAKATEYIRLMTPDLDSPSAP